MNERNHYQVLGVARNATLDEIRDAWKKQLKLWHPDRTRHPAAELHSRELNLAYEMLSDPLRRAQYDRELRGEAAPPVAVQAQPQPRPGPPPHFEPYGPRSTLHPPPSRPSTPPAGEPPPATSSVSGSGASGSAPDAGTGSNWTSGLVAWLRKPGRKA